MLNIKILGSGCDNCKKVEAVARQAVVNLGIQAEFQKVTNHDEIYRYPIFSTPGLVIDEQVVCAGRIPAESEVITWLANAQQATN